MNAIELANDQYLDACFKGEKLYGDDFSSERIASWFKDEEEGYYQLGANDAQSYQYGYHALNDHHGFRFLPQIDRLHVLGIGSAYGHELLPIVERSVALTILEPASGFMSTEINGVPVRYVKPNQSGELPFQADAFDLVTCFGVLHHIPNVSHVLGELFRCLRPGGHLLMREPIISMGDWRFPRRGLTKNERGLPLPLLRTILTNVGFEVVHEARCCFSLTPRLLRLIKQPGYNSRFGVAIDSLICRMPIWSRHYHPRHLLDKLRPTSAALVLRKPLHAAFAQGNNQ